MKIISYHTPAAYIEATYSFLMLHELRNNLIIGLMNNFTNPHQHHENCVFINLIENDTIILTSIKTLSRAIVAGTTDNTDSVAYLVQYYVTNKIEITGVFGTKNLAEKFATLYPSNFSINASMMVHELSEINNLKTAKGILRMAIIKDLPIINDYSILFQEEAALSIRHDKTTLEKLNISKIKQERIYVWENKNEIKSIAAIVRMTQNYGIIGMVFTPKKFRNNGFATACVKSLSSEIFQKGKTKCGLFTDLSNPTSNQIYAAIGYIPKEEFSDINILY